MTFIITRIALAFPKVFSVLSARPVAAAASLAFQPAYELRKQGLPVRHYRAAASTGAGSAATSPILSASAAEGAEVLPGKRINWRNAFGVRTAAA